MEGVQVNQWRVLVILYMAVCSRPMLWMIFFPLHWFTWCLLLMNPRVLLSGRRLCSLELKSSKLLGTTAQTVLRNWHVSSLFGLARQFTLNWRKVLIVHCELSVLACVWVCNRNSTQPQTRYPHYSQTHPKFDSSTRLPESNTLKSIKNQLYLNPSLGWFWWLFHQKFLWVLDRELLEFEHSALDPSQELSSSSLCLCLLKLLHFN